MTWRDIFTRLWLVLRSRLSRHRVCEECGWIMDFGPRRTEAGVMLHAWRCEDCEALERLEELHAIELRQKHERLLQEASDRAAARRREALYAGLDIGSLNKHYC